MGFGLFKKLKDGFKKGVSWLNQTLKKVKPLAKQILQEAPKIISNERVRNVFEKANDIYDVSSDGIDAIDEAVNKKNYSKAVDWTKANITPRLKHY